MIGDQSLNQRSGLSSPVSENNDMAFHVKLHKSLLSALVVVSNCGEDATQRHCGGPDSTDRDQSSSQSASHAYRNDVAKANRRHSYHKKVCVGRQRTNWAADRLLPEHHHIAAHI